MMRKSVYPVLLAVSLFLCGCCGIAPETQAEKFAAFLESPLILAHTGPGVYSQLPSRWAKDIYLINYSQLYANYADNVDFTLRDRMIVLQKSTAQALYSPASVPVPRYVPGSRPVLEEAVKKCLVAGNEQETVLNIMRFCRDLHEKRYPDQPLEYGGREEKMIERGEILCEELARLAVAMGEIAGIPGRIVLHIGGGHYTSEFYINGAWGWCDPRMGFYLLHDDGRLASVQDFRDDPGIIDRQSDAVKREVVGYTTWEVRAGRCRDLYSHPDELNCFAYYSLADEDKYSFTVLTHEEALNNGLMEYNAIYGKLIGELPKRPR